MLRFIVFSAITFLFLLPSTLFAKDWEKVKTQGKMEFVVVSKEKEADEDVYIDAIRNLCKRGQFCKVMFWSDRSLVPTTWPMTDKQSDGVTVDYVHNPNNNFTQFLWNCRIVNEPSRCFK